jgi:hypothetical protein
MRLSNGREKCCLKTGGDKQMGTSKASKKQSLKPLNLGKLKADLALIMDEINRSNGVLPDYYSPVMWQRLQQTADKVSTAIQCVRMKLSNPTMTSKEIGDKLGVAKMSVSGYLAWNAMLSPQWVKPSEVIDTTPCPVCKAEAGEGCDYHSAPAHKIHKERKAAFRASEAGLDYLTHRATQMEERYGIKAVTA